MTTVIATLQNQYVVCTASRLSFTAITRTVPVPCSFVRCVRRASVVHNLLVRATLHSDLFNLINLFI